MTNYLYEIHSYFIFFDEYILNVKSGEDVNERPEARGIGIIFHNTMEAIYKPYEGKKLIEKNLKRDLKNIDKLLDNEFVNEYGKNYESCLLYTSPSPRDS